MEKRKHLIELDNLLLSSQAADNSTITTTWCQPLYLVARMQPLPAEGTLHVKHQGSSGPPYLSNLFRFQ